MLTSKTVLALVAIQIIVLVTYNTYWQLDSQRLFLNNKPVIGIFTQPTPRTNCSTSYCSYIAASYVKFVEMSGARIIPIPYDADNSTLESIFYNINGILVPGGSTKLEGPSQFTKAIAYMLNLSMQAYENGDSFPVMGVCLGHEAIHYVISGYELDYKISVKGEAPVLHALQHVNQNALLYKDMDDKVYQTLITENVNYYHHSWAVSPDLYLRNQRINETLEITAYNVDIENKNYIASSQGRIYPILTTQYHSEKNPFEWEINADHSVNAIKITQYHSNQFISMARQNGHQFSESITKLIYNYPVYHFENDSFTEVYLMNKVNIMITNEYDE